MRRSRSLKDKASQNEVGATWLPPDLPARPISYPMRRFTSYIIERRQILEIAKHSVS